MRAPFRFFSAWFAGNLVRWVSLPRLRERTGRTLTTVVGVSLGVAVVVAVIIVNQSILTSFTGTVRDVAGSADLQVRAGASGLHEDLLSRVRTVPGVVSAARVIEQTVHVQRRAEPDESLLVVGIDFLNQEDAVFRDRATSGIEAVAADPIAFLNSPFHLVLSRSFATRLGYALHDRIALRTPSGLRDFEIWGFVENKGIGQAYGGAIAVMDYVAMQVAFERGHNVDQIDVAVASGQSVDAVAARIRERIGAAFSVGRPERRSERVEKMLGALSGGLSMASLVAVLVAMFLIYSTLTMSVVQRRHEIGVLRALGTTRRQVVSLFTFEGVIIGMVGSLLGLGLGALLSRAMLTGVQKTVGELFVQVALAGAAPSTSALALGFAVGVVTSTLAAFLPALRAARVEPSEALTSGRHVKLVFHGQRRRWADAAASVLALLSFALLQLPVRSGVPWAASLACVTSVLSGALAMPRLVQLVHKAVRRVLRRAGPGPLVLGVDSLVRDVGRVSSAASALMVGVAMSLAFSSFVSSFVSSTLTWVDQMLPADLWISSGARMAGGRSVAMSDTLYAQLRTFPEIELIERVRMADVDYRDAPIKLIAVDSKVFEGRSRMLMIEGSEADARRGLSSGELVVSENLARRYDLRRGSTLELAVGAGPRRFRVAAVIVEYTSDQGSILIDRDRYVSAWGDTRVDSYKLFLKRGAKAEAVRRAIAARFPQLDLSILTQGEFRAEIEALLDQTFGTMHVLELVAIVIAVLGVINAVLASVLDRSREVGVLRAIGMLRSQVRSMVVLESALIGAAGALGGVLLGLVVGYILLAHINVVQTGWYLPFQPSLVHALLASIPVVLAAACAGVYPASVAARKPLSNALVYE